MMKKIFIVSLMYFTVIGLLIGQQEVFKTDIAPTIDGDINEQIWEDANENIIESISLDEPTISSALWKAVWDDDYIYIMVKVEDDVVFSDAEGKAWLNDGVEFFFDIDNSDSEVYDDEGDYQIRFNLFDESMSGGPDEADFVGKLLENDNGYIVESKFSWNDLKQSLSVNFVHETEIGFEIQINDNDGTDDQRIGALSWTAEDNTAWQDPRVFGTIILKNNATITNDFYKKPLIIYPTLVSQLINIENAAIGDKLYICDASGKIFHWNAIQSYHDQIYVSDLPTGIYFLRIISENKIIKNIKILKQ